MENNTFVENVLQVFFVILCLIIFFGYFYLMFIRINDERITKKVI